MSDSNIHENRDLVPEELESLTRRIEKLEADRTGSAIGAPPRPVAVSPWRLGLGCALLTVSVVLSGVLVHSHLFDSSPPGCGRESGCDSLTNSVWGKVPLIDWPVSFVGFAYFVAALSIWTVSSTGITIPLLGLIRLGALASAGFLTIMIFQWHLCLYCLGSHLGNLAFWVTSERTPRLDSAPWRPLIGATLIMAGVSFGLGGGEFLRRGWESESNQRELEESRAEILAQAERREEDGLPREPEVATLDRDDRGRQDETVFTGRYRWGPEITPIRIVMFTDYQCPSCQLYEHQVRELMETQTEISISVKHYPMCKDCNPHFEKHNKHPDACWAARAAEAAGMLGGSDAFWEMHQWLFELFSRKGKFTEDALIAQAEKMGLSKKDYLETLGSDETLRRVEADVAQALELGIYYTPMIFINGIELRGIFEPNALVDTVTKIAERKIRPGHAAHDRPAPAQEKFVADWRLQRSMTVDPRHLVIDTPDPDVDIVLWADYGKNAISFVDQADAVIRRFAGTEGRVRYSVRHYPMHRGCNPVALSDQDLRSCIGARAVEAASIIDPAAGVRKIHDWLLRHPEFDERSLRQGVIELGGDPDHFFATMGTSVVEEAIASDARRGKELSRRIAPQLRIPLIFVNGKYVPRFHRKGDNVLERILREAAAGE